MMPGVQEPPKRAILLAFGLVLALTAVKLVWAESLGSAPPFMLYFGAILVGAWFGGWKLGAAVTVVSALIAATFFMQPIYVLSVDRAREVVLLVLFVLEGGAITVIASRLQRERLRAAADAQAALLSLAKLESVMGGVDEGITVQDGSGKLMYANRPAAELVGYASGAALLAATPEEISRRYELFSTDGARFSPADLPARRVLAGEPAPELLLRFRRVDSGEDRWALVRARPVRLADSDVPFAVNVFRDVTEQHRHEEELQVSREWFATALRSIGDAVIATDATGAITFMNPVAEQLTGWQNADAVGKPLLDVFRIVQEDTREPVESPVDRVLREGRVVGLANHTLLIARGGQELAIDDSAAPIRSSSDELVGTVLVFRDVSRKRDEERTRVRLYEEQVLARERVDAARREAELANRAKDEFLAMLGHELRNPLAPIVTALQLMKLRGADQFEKERSIIERQVRHVVTLVDDLLDVSRITRGKVELAKEPLDLAELVTKGLELAAPIIEERQHDVSISVSRGLMIEGDPVRLAQVISNLLVNAAKYTPRRGKVDVSALQTGAEIVLRVRDNGVGIESELLPRVFDLFVQGGQSLDRGKGGLGLGLAIVRSVVELHGGRVSAESEGAGKGSRFEVTLPTALARRMEARQAALAPLLPAVSGARVLVVDDNLDALELLAEALQLKGYDAHVAQDAASALQAAVQFRPAVALLDIGLPVMNGYELARRLRATPGLEGIKLAALTGYGQPSDRELARAAGFDEHLVKPISIEAVQEVVDRLVAAN